MPRGRNAKTTSATVHPPRMPAAGQVRKSSDTERRKLNSYAQPATLPTACSCYVLFGKVTPSGLGLTTAVAGCAHAHV